MKSRKALLLLCGIILSMLAASVAIKSSQPTTPIATAQAQDPKAQIKHQRRDIQIRGCGKKSSSL
jgi:hypothetical protein